MKQKLLFYFLLLISASSLTWLSCKKNIKDEPVAPESPAFAIPAATPVTGSVHGIVVDQNNNPVDAAIIKIGANTITTGSNGTFLFKNVTLDKYISTVTVDKAGFFKGVRSFSANATLNYVSIKLIPKTLSSSVASDNPALVSLSNGTTINFQPNSIVVKSSGAAYNGQVNVYASYIDPTSADISTMVPGSLMGQDANNLYTLQSTGMIAVDLESPSGEALQLISSLPATIKMPIPSSLVSKAPSTIDTWSLDDRGVWIKEGTATKNGNAYDMQVTHFSFWNCDISANAAFLEIHVVDGEGNPMTNTLVSLTIANYGSVFSTIYEYTDSLGNASGFVPNGLELVLGVNGNPFDCTNPMYSQNIGPFTTNSTITVTAVFNTSNILNVSGYVNDCNNEPLPNGTAIIKTSPYQYYYTSITNGNYNIDILHCDVISNVQVTAVDNSSGAQAASGVVAVSGTSVTVPALQACGGGTQNAVFTFGVSQGMCMVAQSSGIYTVNVPITGGNTISILTDVIVPGSYSITTTTQNGITFNASGTFTTGGPQQSVVLVASGTPVSAGNFTFTPQTSGATGCPFNITVNPASAIFTIGGGTCSHAPIAGAYIAGTLIDSNVNNNVVEVPVNFQTSGPFSIRSNTVNGYWFEGGGTIFITGTIYVPMLARGTPIAGGIDYFTVYSSDGTPGCTFPVSVSGAGSAQFTYESTATDCLNYTVGGTFAAGTPVNTQTNTVTVSVNVSSPGSYNIIVGKDNGISFSASGTFTNTGIQTVTLIPEGTPTISGTYFYTVQGGNTPGCGFYIDVN